MTYTTIHCIRYDSLFTCRGSPVNREEAFEREEDTDIIADSFSDAEMAYAFAGRGTALALTWKPSTPVLSFSTRR